MIELKLIDKTPNDVIDIVRQLRNNGHIQGVDFDFEYRPPKFDEFSNDAVYNRCTVFTFYKEELATWFSLRHL